ncbi:MAG: DegV family EDD domain-containing protein, partial [Anaerolineae bacterium]|nr:DegV family EDD domain-containing protein [Anaerolineae bacterium]
ESPSVAEFAQVYSQLATISDGIISIHPSRRLFSSWENALMAARHIGGHCPIEVIDSQTLSTGQAMLVDVAARCIQQGISFDEVVRKVRGAADLVYSIFCVDTLDTLLQNKVLSSSHAILGSMLGIKPFLMIEEGMLKAVEKAHTRAQALERLVEYVVEFTEIEDIIVLQGQSTLPEEILTIQDQLAIAFDDRCVSCVPYGPSLARLIGLDALGIFVLESEAEEFDEPFS